MSVKIEVGGQLAIQRQLDLLKLPPAKRKRLLGQIGRKVRTATRKRLRAQKGLDGQAWEARKGRGQRRMLRKLGRHLAVHSQSNRVDITFNNPLVGRIARQHQEGISEVMTSGRMRRIHGTPDYDAPASRSLARALRQEGFTIARHGGKGRKRPTLRWITEHLTQGQAGLILRQLQDKETKTRWEIPLPARSFLGATQTEIDAMADHLIEQTLKQVRRP
ncbi:phage virion morphogenesis protein [Hahella ganghwensis]|uniref:phage virion morphogenesis protein n=1 Tax=Hahella ganghwensis TaxID=286420 RepID=UPI00037C54B7|nr:phage virion morphogenesis protein [Hahella ganghwensis]